jgi:hypothetical protein
MLLQFRPPLCAQVLVSERIPYKFQLFLGFEVSIAAHHGPPQLASFTSSKIEQRPDRDGSEHSNAYQYPPQPTGHLLSPQLNAELVKAHSELWLTVRKFHGRLNRCGTRTRPRRQPRLA